MFGTVSTLWVKKRKIPYCFHIFTKNSFTRPFPLNICNKAIIKDATTPWMYVYTTLWNISVGKLAWPEHWGTVCWTGTVQAAFVVIETSHNDRFPWFWPQNQLISNHCSLSLTCKHFAAVFLFFVCYVCMQLVILWIFHCGSCEKIESLNQMKISSCSDCFDQPCLA